MTTAVTTREETLADALDRKSLELYSKAEWKESRANYEKFGIDVNYYDMQCEVFETLFESEPKLFDGYEWINSEDGMPLWVRPGAEWIPEHELEDDTELLW